MSAFDEDQPFDEDEEMPLTERDLADDAQWKIIQKNTFTRWANEHLKTINKGINDLEADLADGLRLIGLVEVLSGKKFRKVNKRPNFRTQKLENVTMVLAFLEEDEGIKIVNIDSGDIVDQKLKLILGLIWTLILHYSISMPMWEGEEPQPQEGGPTPKQRLLNWINNKVPELPIKNFTTDWNDGKAIGALVDAVAPGLCPDWEDWDPKKAKENAKEAMDAAEKWLDVPQLIKPDEMTNPKVDDLSMMTYLSQFPQAKLKPGAPLRPKLSAGKVRAYGPGLEPKGNMVGSQAKFTVETFGAGKGSLDLLVLDPKGKQVKCDSVFNKDKKMTYSCVYVPNMEGDFKVIVKYGEKEIAKSPFSVKVEGAAGDASKVTAKGPGLEKTGVIVNTKTYFEIFTKDAGKGNVDVAIMDPNGHRDKIKPTVTPQKDGVYLVEYTATVVGLYSINISFAGKPIPNSPYGVNVAPAINPKAVYATGRGIQPRGVRIKQHAEFKVHTKGAGTAEVKVQVIGPGGQNIKCEIKPSKTEEGVYECFYIPPKVGQYVINITFGGHHITKSPFRVDVGPEKTSKIVAYGPGLEGGVVNQPACFTVETNGETGALGFSIEGPSQAKIDCKDNGDGSADVTYWPTAPGEYAVHIMCEEEDIPQAPYMAQIQPATTEFDASKVTAKGPGLEKTGVIINKWAEFTVDARKAGKPPVQPGKPAAPLHIMCLDTNYKPVNVEVKDKKDGTYECRYNPKNPTRHTIIITWGSVSIPKSPFRVSVSQPCVPGNVKVYGPGVEKGVKTFVKTYFKVDCTTAGPGDVGIVLVDERGKDVPVKTVDNKDGTFTVEYEPTTVGMYTVQVYFAEKEIPKSPIKVKVESSIDLSKVTVKGLDTPITVNEKRTIIIDTTKTTKKDAVCTVLIVFPSGKTVELPVTKITEGYSAVFTSTETGIHKVTIKYAMQEVPKSPFSVTVETKVEIKEVTVTGLDTPIPLGETRLVHILTPTQKSKAPCKVTVTTPKKKTVELPVKDSPDGYTTSFTPTETGPHKVEVTYDKKPVDKSPFTVNVEPKKTTPKVEVRGLEKPIQVGENRPITIDTSSMPKKDSPCKVTVTSPKKKTVELPVKKSPEGYTTSLTPSETGPHKVEVTYDKKPVPDSPFPVEVVPKGAAVPAAELPKGDVIVKGLEAPVAPGEKRPVTIVTTNAPKKDAPCKVTNITPKKKTNDLKTKKVSEGYETTFSTWDTGTHIIKVEYDGKEIPSSPFEVVVEKIDVTKVTVKGLDSPIPLGETRKISIITKETGRVNAVCKVTVTTPKGETSDLPTELKTDGYDCMFTPKVPGKHTVKIEYAGKPVPNSPFTVHVETIDVSKVLVKGLETPIMVGENRPISIVTTAVGKEVPCRVLVTTPKNAVSELPTFKTADGHGTSFTPSEIGPHKVTVECAGQDVPGSPFPVMVEKKSTKAVVRGLETPIQVGEKRPIQVIAPTKKEGRFGPEPTCKVFATNPKGRTSELPISVTATAFETTYKPTEMGTHKVKVEYMDKEVPGSPFSVDVLKPVDVSKVKVKGLEKPVEVNEKRPVSIITSEIGEEVPCRVTVMNPKNATEELPTTKTPEGHETTFAPTEIGPHKVMVECAGKEVPDSPFTVQVEKKILRIGVKGLEKPIQVGENRPVQIMAPTKKESRFAPEPTCKAVMTNPKGKTFELPVQKTDKAFETVVTPRDTGPHKISIEYNGKEIPDSPYTVDVMKPVDVSKVTVTGLDTPVQVNTKRPVSINTAPVGEEVPCTVKVTTPKNQTAELPLKKTPEGFDTTFAPTETGPHKVTVEVAGKEVPGSPFNVPVEKKITTITTKGLDTPIQVGEKRKIEIIAPTKKEGRFGPEPYATIVATTPKGRTVELPVAVTSTSFETTYGPQETGPHKVKVEYMGKDVPGSPFTVSCEKPMDKALAGVQVRGLDTPVTVGETRPIIVDTQHAGKPDAPCELSAENPKGQTVTLPTKKTPTGYETTFAPLEPGPHKVKVQYAGQEIPKSPFEVAVEPSRAELKGVEVSGLDTPVTVGEKRPIDIKTGKPDAPCKVTATNPKGKPEELPTKKTKDGYQATFAPLEVGPYKVKVEYAGKEIPKSPFSVPVEPKVDLNKVEVKGLETPVKVGEKRPVAIVTKDTGNPEAPCKVTAVNPKKEPTECPLRKSKEGYETMFAPLEDGPHLVKVEVAGKEIPKSPFKVDVPKLDLNKVDIKGLEKPVEVDEIRKFMVETKAVSEFEIPCKVTASTPKGQTLFLPTKKVPEGYECTFSPKEVGPHKVKVEYAGHEVPKSPVNVTVEPKLDLKKLKVEGLEKPIPLGETRPISIDTTATGKPDAPCKLFAKGPTSPYIEIPTKKTPKGYEAQYTPIEPGPNAIKVEYAEKEVSKTPFVVNVETDIDVSKVQVQGLEAPIEVGEPRPISINTLSTGKPDAPCKVTVTNPKGKVVELPIQKKPEGYGTTFTPTEPGPHKVSVNFAGKEVPRSPFNVNVQPKANVGAVKVKGLETPIEVGENRPIEIDTSSTGRPDAPCKVSITNPKGQTAELPTKQKPSGYETLFAPLEPGPHLVNVTFNEKEVPKSPFSVNVEPKADIGKVKVMGLETPIEVDEVRPIKVDTTQAGQPDAPCYVMTTNPQGEVKELPAQKIPEGYEAIFAPLEPGPHLVNINFAGKDVPKSPFPVTVEPKRDVVTIDVLGLETPIEVDEVRPIKVDTTAAGRPDAPCHVTMTNPRGEVFELPAQKIPEGYEAIFAPLEPGPHLVNVNFAGKEVPKSPFPVTVEPKCDIGAVDVLGLETPVKVGEPRPVTVMTSTTGKPDAPCKVEVTNPRGQKREVPTKKIPEGYIATLTPEEVGPHKVDVKFNNKEIPKSPFNVMAEPAIDFNKVTVSGLQEPVEVGEIRPIKVDTAKCGVVDAPCQITATNPVGQVRELPLQKTPAGYEGQFAPLEEGPHLVAVKYAGKELPKSPFPVSAVPQGPPASKVKAYGPGLERGMATEPAKFTIDTRSVTQPGGLGVTVEGPTESKIECRDNQDGTCDVTYYPTTPGDYNINITYADEHIPKSPFQSKIAPSANIDVSGVKAYGPGLEPDVFLDSPTSFTVDAKSVTPTGEGKVRAIVTSPSGQRIESLVKNKEDGTYDVLYTPYEQGTNRVDVTYEDIPIPESPMEVKAAPGCDASRVRAYGPGLEGGFTDDKQVFTVDVRNAGQGGLALAIDGPAETQINCKDNRDGTCQVEYQPNKPGDYDVTIKFADQHITGSPFHVGIKQPVNPAKVQCYGPGLDSRQVQAGRPATFTVDTTEAGEAPLDVTYTDSTGRTRPVELVPVAEGKFNATYKPDDQGPCKVDVKFANQPVPHSPFKVDVQPGCKADKVRVPAWEELPADCKNVKPCLASIPEQFVIDCREAGREQPETLIQRPDGTYIRPSLQDNGDGTWTVQYTPEDVGPYAINIKYEDEFVPNIPLRAVANKTGNAQKCKITEGLQRMVQVNKETTITVDASMAGTGKVTCRIKSQSGTELDIDIIENDDGTFNIVFTPNVEGDYTINIQFGGEPIPEGNYIVQAVDEDKYRDFCQQQVGEDIITADTVDATHAAPQLHRPVEFKVPVGPVFNFVTAYIIPPSGKRMFPKIEDNKDGSVTLKYQPKETGLHALHVCYNNQEITGSPFQFHVDAVDSGFVTAYGPGLSHGVANEPAEFTIVTKDAGAGGLSLAIEGPSKTEIKCVDNGDGTCTVTYLPTAPGEYNITVKFADKHISGSPFVAKVTPGEQRQRAQLGRSSEVSLKITETDITSLTAIIHSPSGKEEPCMLKRLPNGHLGISFTPREVGEHLVDVLRNGQHIENSPFKINVGESELGNAGNVRVYGRGLEEGMANQVNEFVVDTREAGYGGLSLSIEGPSKADIECHDNEDGTCRVTYKPTEPGTYIINIKFADEHVPGSPFKVKIGGEASERITERIMRHQQAVDVTHVGSQCELSLKIPVSFLRMAAAYSVTRTGTSPFDMTASVTSPSGITELCDVVSLDDCHYSIKFVPNEMGIHTVSVKHKDMHIPGSPFQFTVGPIAGGGAHKVHAAGLGLIRGEVNEPAEFNIYTREAGAGGLSIAVEGPSKAEVDFEDRKDGSCGVTYTVTEPGEYLVSIKFNDEHIPESPFRVPISPSIGEAKKLSVSALQNKGLQIGKPCAFVVNFNGAPRGKLQAKVVTPSGAEEDALIQEIDDGEYAVRFIPRENGPHLVYVSFNGCQIPDSPFRIQVGTVHADPGMVQAYGDGLRTGKTGQVCKFIVNTVNAGAGALAVTVEGPSKVKLECKEVDDGYEFTYTPTAPGDYLITIKYAGTSIVSSPFKAKIEGTGKSTGFQEQASVVVETVTKTSVMSKFSSLPPMVSDASKVTCDGNGLKKGYRNKQCTFNVDTSKAGNNMLFIGMIGPKGPCEELCVKHIPGNPYKITYVVKERGDYMLIVKWGEEQIPGSPFCVHVD